MFGVAGTVLTWLPTLFGMPSLNTIKLALYAGAALAVVTGLLVVRQHYINKGYDDAIHAVATQDQIAIHTAAAAVTTARECNDTDGMRWNTETGKCERR